MMIALNFLVVIVSEDLTPNLSTSIKLKSSSLVKPHPQPLSKGRREFDPDASKHFSFRIISAIFLVDYFESALYFPVLFDETSSPFIVYSEGEGSPTPVNFYIFFSIFESPRLHFFISIKSDALAFLPFRGRGCQHNWYSGVLIK